MKRGNIYETDFMLWRFQYLGIRRRKQRTAALGCALDKSSSGKIKQRKIQSDWRRVMWTDDCFWRSTSWWTEGDSTSANFAGNTCTGRCDHSYAGNQWLQNSFRSICRCDRKGDSSTSGSDSGICSKSEGSSDVTDLSWGKSMAGRLRSGVFQRVGGRIQKSPVCIRKNSKRTSDWISSGSGLCTLLWGWSGTPQCIWS